MASDSATNFRLAKEAISQLGKNPLSDRWITEFEESMDAWDVACALLNEPLENTTFRFMGAKMLYSKVKKDFLQLNPTSAQQLTTTLVARIILLTKEPTMDMPVCRFVCLALSSLSIQLEEDGIISRILGWLNEIISIKPLVILELLILLAEECDDQRFKNTRISQQLTESVDQVFDFLNALMGSPIDVPTYRQVLRCLMIWTATTNIPAQTVAQKAIYGRALSGLLNLDILEESCEVIMMILRKFCVVPDWERDAIDARDDDSAPADDKTPQSEEVVLALIPHVLNMINSWSAHRVDENTDSEELDKSRAMTRLFTRVSATSIVLMVEGKLAQGENELLSQILQCLSFQYSQEIATRPLDFFEQLSLRCEYSDEPDKSTLKSKYSSCFVALLQIAHTQLQNLDVCDDPEDIDIFRADWKGSIISCCRVLGSDVCMREMCSLIQKDSTNVKSLEATLTIVDKLAGSNYILTTEATCIPWIINTALPSLMQIPQLQNIIIQLIGTLSHWLVANPAFHLPLMGVLQQALASPTQSIIASEAILNISRAICNKKSSSSTIPVLELHTQLLETRRLHGNTYFMADLNILQVCALVISNSTTTQGEAEVALQSILEPITQSLVQQIGEIELNNLPSTNALLDIDKLTCIFRHTQVRSLPGVVHPLLNLFVHLSPILQKLMSVSPSFDTIDKVCRFYKYLIQGLRDDFIPCLAQMCAHIAEAFNIYFTSSFLYLASQCIKGYGKTKELEPVLLQLFHALSDIFIRQSSSIEQQLENDPEVVEEFFFLSSRILSECPSLLIYGSDPARLVRIIQIGLLALRIPNIRAQKGLLDFFTVLLSVVDPSSELRKKKNLSLYDPSTVSMLESLVPQFAPSLVSNLLENVSGRIPPSALNLDESKASISYVILNLVNFINISSSPPGTMQVITYLYVSAIFDLFLIVTDPMQRFG